MEWVETTGRTIEEALDTALDQLGVHEEDAEYEVIEQPKAGFLGRFGGSEARIRARIRPLSREKPSDRRRRKGGRRPERGQPSKQGGRGGSRSGPGRPDAPRSASKAGGTGDAEPKSTQRAPRTRQPREDSTVEQESSLSVEEQSQVAADFVETLVEAIGLEGEVAHQVDDDDIVMVTVDGDQLGLLVGPKGATINAIEELARAVVQRESGGNAARVRLDVAGYRAKRREALAQFTRGLVQQVIDSGEEQALEPMPAPDRKVVHDVVNEVDGVETTSEGEDPRRYVVIRPV